MCTHKPAVVSLHARQSPSAGSMSISQKKRVQNSKEYYMFLEQAIEQAKTAPRSRRPHFHWSQVPQPSATGW